tara:strand:+ start:118 stop:297 length:180 start_codon:yes stop_codon:yes gene_type:complete
MDITSAQFLNNPITNEANSLIKVTIDGKEMFVPLDSDNCHYAEILRQVAAGELTIADAD